MKKSKKKKVKFEQDLMKEDANLDELKGDEELGGAILGDVKIKDIETKIPTYEDVQLPTYFQPASSIQHAIYMMSTLSMIPRVEMDYAQFEPQMQAQSEDRVLNSILKGTTGKGAKHDHPRVSRAIIESLKEHPDLLHMYM